MRKLTELEGVVRRALGEDGGAFEVAHHPTNVILRVIAAYGMGWDHVSVSLPNRTPNWREMEYVRKIFFEPDEVVMQLHVPESKHINIHDNCLHMWRPHDQEIPLPPDIMV